MKMIAWLIILPLVLSVMAGCWDYRDVGQMDIVSCMGIDIDANGLYHVTLEIAGMSGGGGEDAGGGAPAPLLVGGEGVTLMQALRSLSARTANELFYNHSKALLLGEAAARAGLDAIVDALTRNSETYLGMPVMIGKDTTAAACLAAKPVGAPLIGTQLGGSLKLEAKVLGAAPQVPVYKLHDMLKTPGLCVTLPAVALTQAQPKPPDAQAEAHSQPPENVFICATAVFDGAKLAGFIDAQESAAFLLATGKLSGGVLSLNMGQGQTIGEEVLAARAQTRYEAGGQTPRFHVTLDVSAAVAEAGQGGHEKLASSEGVAQMEAETAQKISADVQAIIRKMQTQWQTDIFGFGALLANKHPEVWQTLSHDWHASFGRAQITVDTNVKIRDSQCKLR